MSDKVRYTVEIKCPHEIVWTKMREFDDEYDAEDYADQEMGSYNFPINVRVVMHSEVVLYLDGENQQ